MDELDQVLESINRKEHRDQVISSWRTKLENGKLQSVNLSRLELESLPGNIFSGCKQLESIILAHNNLRILPSELFVNLPALRYIWLHSNELEDIGTEFQNLNKLEWLYLNNNQLTTIDSESFQGSSELRDLRFNKNHISNFAENLLINLPYLIIFASKGCELTYLADDFFEANKYLERIYLQNNNLSDLPASVLKLPRLKKVWLKGNEFDNINGPLSKEDLTKYISSKQ